MKRAREKSNCCGARKNLRVLRRLISSTAATPPAPCFPHCGRSRSSPHPLKELWEKVKVKEVVTKTDSDHRMSSDGQLTYQYASITSDNRQEANGREEFPITDLGITLTDEDWEGLIAGTSKTFTYTVKEGQLSGDPFTPYEGTFTMNGKKMRQTGTDLYADADKTTAATSLDGSKSPYAGKAVITNDLVLAKINLLKVEAAHPDKAIDGVTFTLLQDSNTPTSGEPTYEAATDTTAVTGGETLTTADGGKLKLPDLAPGAYWLLEKSVPTGYVMRDSGHPIGIVVSDEGAVTLVSDATFVGNMIPKLTGPNDKGEYQLKVPNMRTYALPAAGGLGEMPFLFLGAFLAALAVGGFRTLRRPLAAARAGSRAARGRR